jgi:hypothetical protein
MDVSVLTPAKQWTEYIHPVPVKQVRKCPFQDKILPGGRVKKLGKSLIY